MKRNVSLVVGLFVLFVVGCLALGILLAVVVFGARMPTLGPRVALVRVEGPITDPKDVIEQLVHHRKSARIQALVVRIDSPGGAVGASQEIYREIKRLRDGEGRDKPVPVVASFGNVAASGGYYVACAADRIVSNPGTITGSIGVIMQTVEGLGLIDKIGLKFNTIKSGEFKDSGSLAREMTDSDRAVLQEAIDDVHAQFVADVVQGRRDALARVLADQRGTSPSLTTDEMLEGYVRELADGRIYTGAQALERGLIDDLGGLKDAVTLACELAAIPPDSEVVEKRDQKSFLRELLFGSADSLLSSLPKRSHAPLQYRLP